MYLSRGASEETRKMSRKIVRGVRAPRTCRSNSHGLKVFFCHVIAENSFHTLVRFGIVKKIFRVL